MGLKPLDGYPTFAQFIAKDPDAAVYRKFESLSARNLLYQQSRLHHLEEELQKLDRQDAFDAIDINNQAGKKVAREWDHFAHDDNDKARHRRELQERIKEYIKEYRTHRVQLTVTNFYCTHKRR